MRNIISLDDELLIIKDSGSTPRLLLHSCCAPCASYVLECLAPHFNVTLLYFNPNIQPRAEYEKRFGEFAKLLSNAVYPNNPETICSEYDSAVFEPISAQFFVEKEGGQRCSLCFELRLRKTARLGIENGFDYFATTLSVSPHKNAKILNEVGIEIAEELGIKYLCADFKKRDGYRRSVELSKLYGLYRQQYCGCASSMMR